MNILWLRAISLQYPDAIISYLSAESNSEVTDALYLKSECSFRLSACCLNYLNLLRKSSLSINYSLEIRFNRAI